VSFCPNKVYRMGEGKVEVVNPYGCEVGCSECVSKCSEHAISFPSLTGLVEILRPLRAKYGQEVR